MTDSRIYHWMEQHPQLAEMAMEFNQPVPSAIHPDRLPANFPAIVAELEQHSRGRRRLQLQTRKNIGFGQELFLDFEPLLRRFALLSWRELKHLATLAGAVSLGPGFARLIRKTDRDLVRANLGNDLVELAVQQTQLAPIFPNDDSSSVTEMNPKKVELIGWNWLATCFREEPDDFLRRLELKFPSSISLTASTGFEGTQNNRNFDISRIVRCLRSLLITRIRTDLEPCFI